MLQPELNSASTVLLFQPVNMCCIYLSLSDMSMLTLLNDGSLHSAKLRSLPFTRASEVEPVSENIPLRHPEICDSLSLLQVPCGQSLVQTVEEICGI